MGVFIYDIPLLSSQAIFVSTRACDLKRDVCIASVDLVMEIEAFAFSQHRKRNLLYFAATTQSTMDYSPKAVKDGVVDSPLNRKVPIVVNSPSPLRSKAMLKFLESNKQDNNGVQHNLYLGLPPASSRKTLMVLRLYHLPSNCTEMVSLSFHL